MFELLLRREGLNFDFNYFRMEASKKLATVMVLVAMMLGIFGVDGQDISCGDVTSDLGPCADYLTSGGTPSSDCCQGVVAVSRLATSRRARQSICQCLESAANDIQPLASAVSALPSFCGVAFPYSFSTTQDCSRYQFLTSPPPPPLIGTTILYIYVFHEVFPQLSHYNLLQQE
mgnify:CR=1 FL=1